MVTGLLYGQDGKQVIRAMTHEFVTKFAARNHALRCKDLLDLDLSTTEGVQAYRSQNLKTKCDEFVSSSVAILFDISQNAAGE